MPKGKYTTFGYTLNNYTEQELQAVRNHPEWIVHHVWELEKGEKTGTPHVQGLVKLKSQQRTGFLNRHWLPRGSFNGLGSDEYKQNMKNYAQKQDATATSAATSSRFTEPILFPAVIPEMIVEEIDSLGLYPNEKCDEVNFPARKDERELAVALWDASPVAEQQKWKKEGFERGDLYDYPMSAALVVAKRRLVQRFRVETLVSRPEMDTIVRSYYHQILSRIKHKRTNALPEEEDDHEEEVSNAGKTPPLPSSPPESDAESDCD